MNQVDKVDKVDKAAQEQVLIQGTAAAANGRIDYEGKVFRSSAAETASGGDTPIGRYHQSGDLVWAEFSGGAVRQGFLVGHRDRAGRIDFAYCQLLRDARGERAETVISGRCVSTPEILPDGRIRLREDWERFGPAAARGVSHIEEVRDVEETGDGGMSGM